ncbi:helix-turn-helix domain-containing protein [Rhizobium johnstonii]|uniref:helix-turn-helix domain-containing protein n=1 Tax=Rhizobium johnstonii TaxID=3019933 RepID=UPI003F9548B9
MNMQVSALRQQHERYQAAHARLWNGPPAKLALVEPVKLVVDEASRPEWKRQHVYFDSHVSVWRSIVRSCLERLASEMRSSVGKGRPVKAIIIEVLDKFPGVSFAELKGPRRDRNIVRARQVAMYEVYTQRDDMSTPMVGNIFGRDHTTVLHAVHKIKAMKAAGEPIYPLDEGM